MDIEELQQRVSDLEAEKARADSGYVEAYDECQNAAHGDPHRFLAVEWRRYSEASRRMVETAATLREAREKLARATVDRD